MIRRKVKLILKVIAILLFSYNIFNIINLNYKDKTFISTYYKNESKYNYEDKMILSIPSINLYNSVIKTDANFKNLNKSLVYYNNDNYDDTIIILGHSGLGFGTYFNRLDEIKINDACFLYKNKHKATYILKRKYVIDDTYVDILNTNRKKKLILITCDKNNKSKRLVLEYDLNTLKPL